MAANRGLNKGRGLGALIPKKIAANSSEEPKKVDITQDETSSAVSEVKAAKTKKAATAKKAVAVKKAAAKKPAKKAAKKAAK